MLFTVILLLFLLIKMHLSIFWDYSVDSSLAGGLLSLAVDSFAVGLIWPHGDNDTLLHNGLSKSAFSVLWGFIKLAIVY